jgi:hypothetical protein
LVPGQGAVEEFVAAGLDSTFDDGVHSGHLNTAEDHVDAGVGEDLPDGGGGDFDAEGEESSWMRR